MTPTGIDDRPPADHGCVHRAAMDLDIIVVPALRARVQNTVLGLEPVDRLDEGILLSRCEVLDVLAAPHC
jgi:hypothetical protein